MMPSYSAPVLLSLVFIGMLAMSWRYASCSTFDIAFTFLAISVFVVLQTFFFHGVASQAGLSTAVKTVDKILDLDPTGKAKDMLRCELHISEADFRHRTAALAQRNLKAISKGGPGIYMYTTAAIGVASLALFILRNIRKGTTPITVSHLLCLVLLPLPFLLQIILYYAVYSRDNLVQTSDAVANCLDQLKTVVGRDLISLWNSDDKLRADMDVRKDVSDRVKDVSGNLDLLLKDIDAMTPSLANLSPDKLSEINGLLADIRSTVKDVTVQLVAVGTAPCMASDKLNAADTARNKLPAVQALAKAITAVSGFTHDGNSGRADVDIILNNWVDNTQDVLAELYRLSLDDHCNKRERVRLLLKKLQQVCKRQQEDKIPNMINRIMHNINGPILAILGLGVAGIALNGNLTGRRLCDAVNMIVVVSLIIVFQVYLWEHIASGKYKTPLEDADGQMLLYMILSKTTTTTARPGKLPAKPASCP